MPGTPRCGCGHSQDVHQHYRAGKDCGICGPSACGQFSKVRGHGTGPIVSAFVSLLAAGRAIAAPNVGRSVRR